MAKDFSVFDSLGDFAPKLDQNEEIYRDPYELIPSNNNFYSPQVVDELAESIFQFGQLQPAVIDSRDGKDYVIAGHTRRLAMIKLIEEGHEEFRKMKCQYLPRKEIEDKFGEDADLAIELIEMQTNLYREKTDWEKMQEVIRTEEIVKKMKTSGRVRDNVQKILKVSGGQQGRFHAIHANLYGQLMEEFKENRIKGSVAYELSKLSVEFQKQACEIFQRDGNLSLEDTKKLQAQENAEKSIPGQMSIAQATGQLRPTADTTPINVDTQIKRLYDKAQKRLKERVENRDKMMVPMRLRDLYNGSRVQNGYLNYRAEKSCIVFNPDSEQEKELHWNDLADILIQKYGKEPRPVKMTTIDAPEAVVTITESAAVKAFCEAYPKKLKTIMRICRRCKDNGEAAKAVQLDFAPGGFSAVGGGKVNYKFMSFSAGIEIEVNNERVSMKYGRLIVEAKNLYDPFSPEFDIETKKPVKMTTIDAPEKPEKKETNAGKCIHREGFTCTLEEAQKTIAGDGENCNRKCCWSCEKHGTCGYECNASAHRPAENIPEKSCQSAAETPDEKQQEDRFVDLNKTVKHPRNTDKIPTAWPEELKDIPIPSTGDLSIYLQKQEDLLKQMTEVEKEEAGFPELVIKKQQMLVAGLRILKNIVEDCQEEPEQPGLPIMKNNDQRKEWLRNYKNWGLWYTDNHTGVKYYKYDFENGARLIVEEYEKEPLPENSWYVPEEPYYMHLIGGPEPDRKGEIPKWTYHSKYNKYPNSETELVEFLKEIQK